jgi:hypothetical protein
MTLAGVVEKYQNSSASASHGRSHGSYGVKSHAAV